MDPLTSSGLFATIVGLLCNYKSEHSGKNLSEFMRWLEEKHHETIAASIRNNAELEDSLGTLLRINHDKLVDRLQRLDLLVSSVAGKLDLFSGIAQAIHRESIFSAQAVSILTQLVDHQAEFFSEDDRVGHRGIYQIVNAKGMYTGKIELDEIQFIENDLDVLISSGMLLLRLTGTGKRRFYITRAAVAFISELKQSAQ
jgi:hypothetical protein